MIQSPEFSRRFTHESPDASWERLRGVVNEYYIAFFIGAGLSIPSKLPSWPGLAAALSETNEEKIREFIKQDISLTAQLGLRRHAMSNEKWISSIRKTLYQPLLNHIDDYSSTISGLSRTDINSNEVASRERMQEFFTRTNPVLMELVKICALDSTKNTTVGAILTTNIDALLQLCDRALHGCSRVLRTVERAHAEAVSDKISVYHLHGYLKPHAVSPEREAADRLVLTEDEYLERNDNPYSWASVILHWALREFQVVFIGSSLTDELVRRALRRSTREYIKDLRAANPKLSEHDIDEDEWRRHFAIVEQSKDQEINAAKNESLAHLGVWPLWVCNYDNDLPQRVRKLGEWVKDITEN